MQLALWWSLWENVSASVRSGDVLSALLYLLTQSNTTVGVIQVKALCCFTRAARPPALYYTPLPKCYVRSAWGGFSSEF